MMKAEYWVMRVVLHRGPMAARQLTLPTVQAHIQSGALALHPDGHIMEPVEVYTEPEPAHEHQAKLQRQDPDGDYRVILNADVPV
jgi:hypothetical protein